MDCDHTRRYCLGRCGRFLATKIHCRTKQSIEIENFFDWIVSTQSKNGVGTQVADHKKVTSILGTKDPLKMVSFASNKFKNIPTNLILNFGIKNSII